MFVIPGGMLSESIAQPCSHVGDAIVFLCVNLFFLVICRQLTREIGLMGVLAQRRLQEGL